MKNGLCPASRLSRAKTEPGAISQHQVLAFGPKPFEGFR